MDFLLWNIYFIYNSKQGFWYKVMMLLMFYCFSRNKTLFV